MDIVTQKMLAEILAESKQRNVAPYSTTAKVKSISNGYVYVEISGSDTTTPVKTKNVSVKVGDIVDLMVSHEDTRITGNRSDVAASSAEVNNVSKAVEESTIALTNDLNIVNNKINAVDNDINMLNNIIDIQNSEIDVISSNVSIMDSNISAINSDITTLDSTVKTQGSTIETLDSTVKTQGSTIETLNSTIETQGSTIETLSSTIETLDSSVKTIDSNIKTINSTIETQGSTIETLNSTIETQGSTIESIESKVTANQSLIETLNSTIETQGSTIETLDSTVKTHGTTIESLDSSVQILNSAFVIKDGTLTGISEIITNILDSDYVTTNLLNANVAWIVDGKIKEGAIGSSEIADASITTAHISELSADVIKAGTLSAERLILTTDEIDPETGKIKKVALITALNAAAETEEGGLLDGAIISDNTITAAKVDVVDLNAFKATIGNFNIGTSSIYNQKESLNDPTNGVYIGTDGIALGQGSLLDVLDDSPFRIRSNGDFHLGGKNNNYINFNPFTGELDISAKTIKMESKTVAEIVDDAFDMLKIGGRNLIISSETLNSEEHELYSPLTSLTYNNEILTYNGEKLSMWKEV